MMIEQLLTGKNMALAGGIFVLTSALKPMFKKFLATSIGQRVMPLAPIALGVAGAFAGMCDGTAWQDKLLLGTLAGYVAGHSFKIGKTSLLGYGIDTEEGTELPPPAVPADPPKPTQPDVPAVPAVPADTK